ncbi:MAG: Aminodeoxychorismate synthase component 1 [Opitutia bacterium UBA7350]|nr:MAG: Aminodeoxychorismate synthase component 1 [Opitutae bacterium UBA7350]
MQVRELEGPWSSEDLLLRFRAAQGFFALDSAQSNDGLGKWSFFGANPYEVITNGADLSELRAAMQRHCPPTHPSIPFTGGAVGYLSYDYGRRLERLPEQAADDRQIPDLHFGLYDGIAALEHRTGKLYLIAHGIHAPEAKVLDALELMFKSPAPETNWEQPVRGSWEWNCTEADFMCSVEAIREYIASGDAYQVNLSRRARCRYQGAPMQLYQALRRGNPAPYGAYIDCGHWQLISTSPEQFLRKSGQTLSTRPIKGTRPRGVGSKEDAALAAELEHSVKERAELLMIVDLVRNDLGRVAEYGSVKVEQLYHQEYYARVMHQTAQVRALMAKGRDIFDCIEALFPGGSITGAPKVRAMEIIEELEPTRRGVYCGSMGYIGFDGEAELNIAIRSLHLKDGWLDYQAGGGIVWDSDPKAELQETLDKGRAIHESIEALCQLS